MKRMAPIRLVIAVTALIFAAVGGWIARLEVEQYAACELIVSLADIGDFEGVVWAVDAGAEVDAEDEKGRSVLHLAARSGHIEGVRALVKAGADVNRRDRIRLLTPLHFAARSGNVQVVRALIADGAIINAQDRDGATPLNYAFVHGGDVERVLRAEGGRSCGELYEKEQAENLQNKAADDDSAAPW